MSSSRFKIGDEVVLAREPRFNGQPAPSSVRGGIQPLIVGREYVVRDISKKHAIGGTGDTFHLDTGSWWCEEDCFEPIGAPSEEEIAELFGILPSPLQKAEAEVKRLTALLEKHGIDPEEE